MPKLRIVPHPKPHPQPTLEELKSELLTVDEAAKHLRIQPQTLRNWLSSRKFTRVKVGGKTFVRKSEVEAYLIQQMGEAWQF